MTHFKTLNCIHNFTHHVNFVADILSTRKYTNYHYLNNLHEKYILILDKIFVGKNNENKDNCAN